MSGELYAEGHFVIIPEWVLDADVSDKAVRLYGVLRSYADHRTGVAFPSRRTLAGRLRIADVKGVDRALTELESIGAVEVLRAINAPGQPRTSNRYLLRHTPRGTNATPHTTEEDQTPSSPPRGASTIGGENATPPGAQMPHPQGSQHPRPQGSQHHRAYGAGTPLTRSNEQEPVLTEQGERRLTAVETAAHRIAQDAQELTKEHYDASGGLARFPAVLGIVKRALSATDGDGHPRYKPDAVRAALTLLRESGRPVTLETMRAAMTTPAAVRGRGYRPGPYRDPDPSTPDAFPERF